MIVQYSSPQRAIQYMLLRPRVQGRELLLCSEGMVMLVIEQNKTRYLNNNVAIKRKKKQKQTKKRKHQQQQLSGPNISTTFNVVNLGAFFFSISLGRNLKMPEC